MMVHEEKKDMENKRREPGFETECKGSGIMVSVCCITYNQASYIRDALEGFVNQQTDFAYEVLIHDDASSDGTAEIIREYAEQYPDLIFSILQTENQYSKGLTNVSGTFNFPRARGKYIAMCEGTTTGPMMPKLQKQVDYLEANPGCSLCFPQRKDRGAGKGTDGACHASL
ncbi:MAG: glycosyltransferase family 2 protein [Clostridium sp.]